MKPPLVLLTGATGFIASHTWLALLAAGHRVLGIDNFSNSSPEVLKRLQTLGGVAPDFIQADVCDASAIDAVFAREPIAAVVHFAAFKAVGESASKPLAYYANNLCHGETRLMTRSTVRLTMIKRVRQSRGLQGSVKVPALRDAVHIARMHPDRRAPAARAVACAQRRG